MTAALDGEVVAQSARGDARHRGARLLPGHHDDGAARGRACWSKRACRCSPTTRGAASTNSAAAPAISPWRRRSAFIGSIDGKIVEPRLAIGGVEPQSAPHCRSRARARGRRTRRQGVSRRGRRRNRCGRPDGRRHHQRGFRRDLVLAVTRRALEARGGIETLRNDCAKKQPWIGQSVERLEDPPLVTGRGEFAGDINFPHQLHMRMVRSAHAHGRIVVDRHRRRRAALPGVFAVWTAADIADVPPIDFREGSIPALDPYRQPVLANGVVRYVGEPVAAVFADRSLYRRGRRRSRRDRDRGVAACCSMRCGAGASSRRARSTEPRSSAQGYGDVDAAFRARRAHRRARARRRPALRRAAGDARRHRPLRRLARHSRIARRRQGAAPQPRTAVAHARHRAESSIHVHESHVGGGFGIRGEIYPEDVLVCVAAKRFKRAGEMDRGPARTPDRRQSFAPADAQDPRRGRRRWRHPRHRRRLFSRPGRLYAHPRDARGAHDGGHPAGAVSRAGLSRDRAISA